jgi:3-methyladenine DNA glycosylase/8-oxoguanine DNA glycosylase
MPRAVSGERWSEAVMHLGRQDERLRDWMERAGPCTIAPRPAAERFDALARAIAGQMVSGASARAVTSRLHLAAGKPLNPASLLAIGPEAVRACGLSGAKTASILDLAGRVAEGRLELAAFPTTRSSPGSRRSAASARGRPTCS